MNILYFFAGVGVNIGSASTNLNYWPEYLLLSPMECKHKI